MISLNKTTVLIWMKIAIEKSHFNSESFALINYIYEPIFKGINLYNIVCIVLHSRVQQWYGNSCFENVSLSLLWSLGVCVCVCGGDFTFYCTSKSPSKNGGVRIASNTYNKLTELDLWCSYLCLLRNKMRFHPCTVSIVCMGPKRFISFLFFHY